MEDFCELQLLLSFNKKTGRCHKQVALMRVPLVCDMQDGMTVQNTSVINLLILIPLLIILA